ncbi:helix-turn-helix domain-containing protein [Paenibacillus thalictri]|uniref:helix-turn-helix domain-containing protein n=1 Tax=Paenibacillus thalictri TaxID=2527873 RepID=UPI0013EF1CA5|nr:helix-turn-helix domain-containing protein [Paenibacillus thalictri]
MSSRKIRSILMIFLISVVGTSLLSLVLYNISTEIIKHQIEQQTRSSLINLSSRVSNLQDRISQSVIDLQNTQEYQLFIKSLPFKDYESSALVILNFVNQLRTMTASLDYVDNITFYNVENGKEYATNGVMNAQFQEFRDEIAKFETLGASQALFDTYNNGSPSVVYIQALPLFQPKPQGYLIFHYNAHFLRGLLQNEQVDSNYLIVNEEHQIVDSYSIDGTPTRSMQLPETLWQHSESTADSNLHSLSAQGNFYILHHPVNQKWSYIYFVKESLALAPIIELRNIVLLSTVILIVFSLVMYALSINLSWRGWNKISELIADSRDMRSKDDFDLLFHKIQGLMQNHNQLEHRMNVILPEAKEAFLRNILEKGCGKQDLVKMKQYNISLGSNPYRCFCVEADDYKALKELYTETDMSRFEYGIICVIREVMGEANISGFVIAENQTRFVGIYELDKKTDDTTLDDGLAKIKSFISEYFPFSVSIGVSQARSDISHIHLSYHEALESLKQKLIAGSNQVIYFNDFTRKETPFSPDVYEIEHDIVRQIREKNREFAYTALDRLIGIKKAENIDYRSLQNYLVNMTLFLFQEFTADHRLISQISISEMVQLATLEEWTEWIRTHCIDSLIDDMIQSERKQYEQISEKLVQHMENHLEQDLRLNEVCKQLGIPLHLANLALKEVHGVTFAEYLLQRRIELSKKWLRETQMSLDEISNFLFYSNAQNFSRAFKKYVGLPPGHYRKQHQTLTEESSV